MVSTFYKDHGLNVEYISRFIESREADNYLSQLKDLAFYQPTLKIRGKNVKPKRQALAYGDPGLTYSFSGAEFPAEPWTPLMLELRERVEKYAGCSFNYVLLNLYGDGSSYISHHKDNETALDATFPIVVLSFGAERTIDFKKAHTPTTSITLEHGSLYSMQKPTNKLFSHGIAADPRVKTMRISLTFRHLLPICELPPAKKPRLELSVNTTSDSKVTSPNDSCSELSQNDLFLQQEGNSEPILAEWNLGQNTFLQIILDDNYNIRIHIRTFKECENGDLRATRKGIFMTAKTWFHFQGKLPHLNFQSLNNSFIANNQLLVTCINEKICILQQMFPLNTSGFFLKPAVLKLSQDQIFKLADYCFEITESILKAIFLIQLPKMVQNMPPVCLNHLEKENAKIYYLNCILNEIELLTNTLFSCVGCMYNASEQNSHDCLMKSTFEKFQLNRQSIYLNLNLYNIVNQLKKMCTCCLRETMFFSQLTLTEIENYVLEVFSKKM